MSWDICVILVDGKKLNFTDIDDYEIIDDGFSIRFFDKVTQRKRTFPYTNCDLKEHKSGVVQNGRFS